MSRPQLKTMAYLSLGSNMGDRMAHLSAVEEKLEAHSSIHILEKSKVYETEPWPLHDAEGAEDRDHSRAEKGEGWYLNQVIKIETTLTPDELLDLSQSIESDIGRSKKNHWGSREIDVDILLYGDLVMESDHLTIPHRHMTDRQFILVPLLEIDSKLKSPASGKLYQSILDEIKNDHRVVPFF